jgi:hypothetical protein
MNTILMIHFNRILIHKFGPANEQHIYQSNVLIVDLLHSSFSTLLGPNTHLRILLSNTLSLHSPLNVRDHVSQPYSTSGNIIVLGISIFKFLERILADKSVWTE